MSGFSPQWLALREPADHAARAHALVADVVAAQVGVDVCRVLDLGAGTGSNLRYLAPRLRAPQEWLLVDDDPMVLAAAATGRPARSDVTQLTRRLDLSREMPADAFTGRTLVTASALLDLVSAAWLERVVQRCRDADAIVLFALSYDGRIVCTPEETEDQWVRELVNRHQRTDKGFGPALGPDAAAVASEQLVAAGYRVRGESSDWRLGPAAAALQRALVSGWADAARDLASDRDAEIRGWCDRRHAHIAAGRSSIVVGHQDVVAVREPAHLEGHSTVAGFRTC